MSEKANIILFKKTGRTPASHLVMDYPTAQDQNNYWGHFESYTVSSATIVKENSIDFDLHIDLSSQTNKNSFDYGVYSWSGYPKPIYFYILRIEYINDKDSLLHCHVDTFETYFAITHSFPASTRVMREHKDRWGASAIIDPVPEAISAPTFVDNYSILTDSLTLANLGSKIKSIKVVYRNIDFTQTYYTPSQSGSPAITIYVELVNRADYFYVTINGQICPDWSYFSQLSSNDLAQVLKVETYANVGLFFSSVSVVPGTPPILALTTAGGFSVANFQEFGTDSSGRMYEVYRKQDKSRALILTETFSKTPVEYTPSKPASKTESRNYLHETKLLSSQFSHIELKLGDISVPISCEKITNFSLSTSYNFEHSFALNTSEMERVSMPAQLRLDNIGKIYTKVAKATFWINTNWEQWLNDFTNQRNAAFVQAGLNVGVSAVGAMVGGPAGASGIISGIMGLTKGLADNAINSGAKINQAKRYGQIQSTGDPTGLFNNSESPWNLPIFINFRLEPIFESMIEDIFYYTGYASNEIKTPNIKTREDFNFIQAAIPYFSREPNGLPLITREHEQDLKTRFGEGLCVIHSDGVNVGGNITLEINQLFNNIAAFCNRERSLT